MYIPADFFKLYELQAVQRYIARESGGKGLFRECSCYE